MGIAHSVNAIISVHKYKAWYVQKVIGVSFTMLLVLSIIALLFFTASHYFYFNIGEKYNFRMYAPFVAVIGILGYFNVLFSNIFRVYGKVFEIALNQSSFPVFMLVAVLFFRGEKLLFALVGANLFAFLISLIVYLVRFPINLKLLCIFRLIKKIQKKGWYLFIYNSSFYLIIISTRSFISAYYSVQEFGYFTFAFTVSNVILLLLNSLSYLIYPKILHRFSNSNVQSNYSLMTKLRDTYITSSHLLLYIGLVLFPLFLIILPQYKNSYSSFMLIALTLVLYSNSFGYSGLLIAKGLEKELSFLSIILLVINIVLVYLFIIIEVDYSMVVLGTMVTYFIFVYFLTKKGRKLLKLNYNLRSTLKDAFPIKLMIPYLLAILIIIVNLSSIIMLIPFGLFIILNKKELFLIKTYIWQILVNPTITDI